MIPAPLYIGWAVAFYFALAALLKWKHRRMQAERRVSRGLRAYATTRGVCQTVSVHS
jgi:hypothetical protein